MARVFLHATRPSDGHPHLASSFPDVGAPAMEAKHLIEDVAMPIDIGPRSLTVITLQSHVRCLGRRPGWLPMRARTLLDDASLPLTFPTPHQVVTGICFKKDERLSGFQEEHNLSPN